MAVGRSLFFPRGGWGPVQPPKAGGLPCLLLADRPHEGDWRPGKNVRINIKCFENILLYKGKTHPPGNQCETGKLPLTIGDGPGRVRERAGEDAEGVVVGRGALLEFIDRPCQYRRTAGAHRSFG